MPDDDYYLTGEEQRVIYEALKLYAVASYVHPVPQQDREIAASLAKEFKPNVN